MMRGERGSFGCIFRNLLLFNGFTGPFLHGLTVLTTCMNTQCCQTFTNAYTLVRNTHSLVELRAVRTQFEFGNAGQEQRESNGIA